VFPGIEKEQQWTEFRKRARIPDITVHDLRRSHGSYLAVSGASLQIIGRALGHRSRQAPKSIRNSFRNQCGKHKARANEKCAS
jgi:integrase